MACDIPNYSSNSGIINPAVLVLSLNKIIMNEPTLRLLRTKLFIPRAHPDLVERPRLTARLSEGLRCKLTLISAPAGSGKTTLIANWKLRIDNLNMAWVSLDKHDNDPSRFWAYIVAALQTLQPQVGQTALAMLQFPQPPPIETFLTELLNAIALIPQDFVLVLDDYHSITNTAIHNALTFLLDHLPAQMHLVIASRTEPPLALPLMRVRRELVELSDSNLRFTLDEIAAFLNRVMGLNLSAGDVQTLEAITEGWIAGLQLAALSMQGMGDVSGLIRSFAGRHRYVFDYLAQEVLQRQPPHLQSFLLQTSVLDRLNASLCDAVVGRQDSQSTLEALEQANLFLVPLDSQRHWYRYHHLFADFLHSRLEQTTQQASLDDLHRRASAWCAEHDLALDAVNHALAAHDVELAVQRVKQFAMPVFNASDLTPVLRWLSALPEARVRADPQLSIVFAWASLATSQFDAIESRLQDVEHALGAQADGTRETLALPAHVRGGLAEVLCIRANLAFHRQDLARVLELSRQALAYLTDEVNIGLFQTRHAFEGVAWFNTALAHEFSGDVPAATEAFNQTLTLSRKGNNLNLVHMASSHLAQLQTMEGQLHRAAELYRQAIELTTAYALPLAGLAHTGLGNIFCEWNDLERAETELAQGLDLGRTWNNWETVLPSYLGLARVRAAQDRWPEAFALLDQATDFAQHSKVPWGAALIEAHRARLAARQGNLQAAARWVQSCGLDLAGDVTYAQESEAIFLARVLVAIGQTDEACRLADKLLSSIETGKRWGRGVEILIVRALALDAQHKRDEALAALARALKLAEPHAYARVFVDEGETMRLMISDFRLRTLAPARSAGVAEQFRSTRDEQANNLLAYLGKLLSAFGSKSISTSEAQADIRNPQTEMIEPLSQRELEVLHRMANGETNQEIADSFVLSLNTVKTHVKNIHSKLGARNRTEAVARARELGLL
jgi:ATP/maltotriose-dependent transcriptional regulator MalT